jgi:hypothetical protein
MPAQKKEGTSKPVQKKLPVDIFKQIQPKEVVIRFDNVIYGKAEYYSMTGKFPKDVQMNSHVFRKMLKSGNIKDDKCLGCNVVIDDTTADNLVLFS